MIRERLREVCERWFLVEPLLFAAWTTHQLVVEPRLRTVRVGRGRIEFNPDWLAGLTRPQLEAVMRCEGVRILLKHPYQRRRENAVLSYAASNLTLQEHLRLDLPLPYACDVFGTHDFDRQYFEFYYHKLSAAPGGGWEHGDASLVGAENAGGWDADDLFSERLDALIREAEESRQWGSLAGTLRERILAGLRPPLDYRAILARFRASVLSTRRVLTRMRPSRRYGFDCLGSRYDFTTRLLVAVDVSGSMSHQDLVHGFSVVNQFFRYGVRSVDVVAFDTEIRGRPLTLTRARREVQVLGRGGTCLQPVLDLLDRDRGYDGLIVFTDGYAPVPTAPRQRRTRILWLFSSPESYRANRSQLAHLGAAACLKGA